mgnify:FL=1
MQGLDLSARNMSPGYGRQIGRTGWLYGALGGVGFAFGAWGLSAAQLAAAHGLLPWLSFGAGLLPAVALMGLASWLSGPARPTWARALIWLATGVALSYGVLLVVVGVTPVLSQTLDPRVRGLLDYSVTVSLQTRWVLSAVALGLFGLILGAIALPGFRDTTLHASAPLQKALPLVLWLALWLLGGRIVAGLVTDPLQVPVQATDRVVEFALDHRGQEIDATLYRQMHLSALNTVDPLLDPEHRIVLSQYDDLVQRAEVLVLVPHGTLRCVVLNADVSQCEALPSD